jgi:hypothetical protein
VTLPFILTNHIYEMIPTKGSTIVIVTTKPKVPWSRIPIAGIYNTSPSPASVIPILKYYIRNIIGRSIPFFFLI